MAYNYYYNISGWTQSQAQDYESEWYVLEYCFLLHNVNS